MSIALSQRGRTDFDRIISLFRAHHTQACIAHTLGVSRQAVNHRLQHWKSVLSKNTLCPDTILSFNELAIELGLTVAQLRHQCAQWSCSYSSLTCCRPAFFTNDQADAVRAMPLAVLRTTPKRPAPKRKRCAYCKQFFIPKPSGTRTVFACYQPTCRYLRREAARRKLLEESTQFRGWHVALIEALKSTGVPDDDQWVGLREAVSLTGITTIQLCWLGYRRVLAIRPHPTKLWHGRPVATYATSQLNIVQMVYQTYHHTIE